MPRDRRAGQAWLAAEHRLQILHACLEKPPRVAKPQFHRARFGRREFFCEITMLRFELGRFRSMNRQSSETVAARRQLQKIEAEIRNCTRAIASDGLTSFLRTRMGSLEFFLEARERVIDHIRLVAGGPAVVVDDEAGDVDGLEIP
jgi:hypothetical protein